MISTASSGVLVAARDTATSHRRPRLTQHDANRRAQLAEACDAIGVDLEVNQLTPDGVRSLLLDRLSHFPGLTIQHLRRQRDAKLIELARKHAASGKAVA